jgi:uncharacterized membrane protein YkvI
MGMQMTEPASTAGALAGHKLILFSLPFIGSLLVFFMGLRFAPLKKGDEWGDMVNRLMAGAATSFVLGIPALVMLMRSMPDAFGAAAQLAQVAGLPSEAGFLLVCACVLLVCAVPGPWLVAAVYLWLQRQKGKDIAEIARDVRDLTGK